VIASVALRSRRLEEAHDCSPSNAITPRCRAGRSLSGKAIARDGWRGALIGRPRCRQRDRPPRRRREGKAIVRSAAAGRSRLGGSTRPVWRRRALGFKPKHARAGRWPDRESESPGRLAWPLLANTRHVGARPQVAEIAAKQPPDPEDAEGPGIVSQTKPESAGVGASAFARARAAGATPAKGTPSGRSRAPRYWRRGGLAA
jgi:hypothetical protein